MSLWFSIIKQVLTAIRNVCVCDTKERVKTVEEGFMADIITI